MTRTAFSGWALWVSMGLIAVNMLVYFPVRQYDFVNFDDPQYVSSNPYVFGGLTWQGVRWAFTTDYQYYWHPLTWLSHMFDVQLYGLNAGGHHLTNLLLHLANTILLFGLLHGMTGALWKSAFVAGLFAVHPMHVESVAWVAERKDVLSTFFWMLTVWAYVGYARQQRLGRYLVVVLLFAFGLMAKPMLVTLPLTLLLLDFWPLGRVSLAATPSERSEWGALGDQQSVVFRLLLEKLPLLVLSVASSIITVVVQQRVGAVAGFDTVPLSLRAQNAVVSYVAYIAQILWPTPLAVFYPYPSSLPGWWVAGSIAGLVGVSVVVLWAGRRHPYLPVGWLWYLGTLVPVIGLVQAGGQARADRFTYVPLIGLFLIAAWAIPDLLARWPPRRIVLPAVAGLVILACAFVARGQVRYWKDSITLWTHSLEVTGGSYLAHHDLGAALAREGRLDEAIANYSEALRLKPDSAEGHNNLANALLRQGRLSEAIPHYSEALRLQPDYAEAHNNLGVALSRQGNIDGAIQEYLAALRTLPNQAGIHYRVAVLLQQRGNTEEAVRHFETVLQLDSGHAEARRALADLKSRSTTVGSGAP